MKINIQISNELIARVQQITGITDKNVLVENALQLLLDIESQKKIENQKKLMSLRGKIEIDDEAYK